MKTLIIIIMFITTTYAIGTQAHHSQAMKAHTVVKVDGNQYLYGLKRFN